MNSGAAGLGAGPGALGRLAVGVSFEWEFAQYELGPMGGRNRHVGLRFQALHPGADQSKNLREVQELVESWVSGQVASSQFEECECGLGPLFLNVNESSGELDQPFVEQVIRAPALREPSFLEHFMRLEEELAIETLEIAQIMRVKIPIRQRMNQGGYLWALAAHGENIKLRCRFSKAKKAICGRVERVWPTNHQAAGSAIAPSRPASRDAESSMMRHLPLRR